MTAPPLIRNATQTDADRAFRCPACGPIVRIDPLLAFIDLAGANHLDYASAYRASMRQLVALELIDQGLTETTAQACAASLVEQFVIAIREPRP